MTARRLARRRTALCLAMLFGAVAVGLADASSAAASFENPQAVGTFVPGTPTLVPRTIPAAARLSDGRILLVGGRRVSNAANGMQDPSLDHGEIYNPILRVWTETPSDLRADGLITPPLTALPDNRVLESGSNVVDANTGQDVSNATIYDRNTNIWTPAAPTLSYGATGTIGMADGRVLRVGGSTTDSVTGAVVEAYTPATNTWQRLADLPQPRTRPRLGVLSNGNIIAIGGAQYLQPAHAPVEIYDPATNSWTVGAAPQCNYGYDDQPLPVLPDGEIAAFAANDCPDEGPGSTRMELYDPTRNAWRVGGQSLRNRQQALKMQLSDGRVLYAGGDYQNRASLTSAEIYDPSTDLFYPAGSMSVGRIRGFAEPLPDGDFMLLGGVSPLAPSRQVDIFHPLGTVIPATGANEGATSVALSSRVSYAPVRPGHATTITGHLSRTAGGDAVAGQSIDVYRRPTADGTWNRIATLTTDTGGDVTVNDAPNEPATYTFVHTANASYRQTSSADVPIQVVPGPFKSRPPANVMSTAGAESITVTWQPPTDDGGQAITGYDVTAYNGPESPRVHVDAAARTGTIKGLTPGTRHQIVVCAIQSQPTQLQGYDPCASGGSQTPTVAPGNGYTPLATPKLGYTTASMPLVAGTDRDVTLAGVPADATAVVVTAQVAGPSSNGYLRLTAGGTNGTASSLLFAAGQRTEATAVVPVRNGQVRLHLSAGRSAVYLDVYGYYRAPVA